MNTNDLEVLNKWACALSREEIQNLPEEEVLRMAVERPDHPGQYGFMLQLPYFQSQEHFTEIMHALMERLQKVEDLQEKMNTGEATQFTEDEFLQISEVAKLFLEKGISEQPPKFVVYMGGVGVGKTTIRREQCANGYVHFEFGEIFTAIKKVFGEEHSRLSSYASLASTLILQDCLESKKNIVIEIIGENKDAIDPVITAMKNIGYEVSFQFISCDPEEAYKRHVNAVKEDPDYLSAHFTQEATLSFFYDQLGLGRMITVSE